MMSYDERWGSINTKRSWINGLVMNSGWYGGWCNDDKLMDREKVHWWIMDI